MWVDGVSETEAQRRGERERENRSFSTNVESRDSSEKVSTSHKALRCIG